VRFSLLCAGAALAASLALSACSSGGNSPSALPSVAAQSLVTSQATGHTATLRLVAVRPAAKNLCPPTKYSLCVYINSAAGSTTATVCAVSNGGGCSWSQMTPVYYGYGYLFSLKNKPISTNKLTEYWDPFPGNPSTQYVTVGNKDLTVSPKGGPTIVDFIEECLQPSGSCSVYRVGLIPQPS
jgi:hypothetical protein